MDRLKPILPTRFDYPKKKKKTRELRRSKIPQTIAYSLSIDANFDVLSKITRLIEWRQTIHVKSRKK